MLEVCDRRNEGRGNEGQDQALADRCVGEAGCNHFVGGGSQCGLMLAEDLCR